MTSRSYNSPRRAQAAAETRSVILRTALELFERDGYRTSAMSDIAARAGVSLNTVYSSVGKKPQLLKALIGDAVDDQGIGETVDAVDAATSAPSVIALIANGTRTVFERHDWLIGTLYDNAASEVDLAHTVIESERRYHARLRGAAVRLDTLRQLDDGVTVDRAAEVLWFYFGFRPWRELRSAGWSWDEAETWLIDQATNALLRRS